MAGEGREAEIEAALARLDAAARRGDVDALIGEAETSAALDPARVLREVFYLLHQAFPVAVSRAVIRRLSPLIPDTEAVQNDLGFLLHGAGDPDGASAAFAAAARRQEARVAGHPLAATGLRILHPPWFIGSFGEMTVRLTVLAKLSALGLLRPMRLVLPAPRAAIVNEPLLDLLAGSVTVVKEGDLLAKFQALAPDLGLDTTCVPLADGRFLYIQQAFRAAEQAWAAAGRGPLISLPPDRIAAGRARLAGIGLPADAWYVVLHVRDPGFHGGAEGRRRLDLSARDADVLTYLPAVERVVARGGRVVRIGGPQSPVLPVLPGLIDYAHSEVRSAELDLVLIAAARCMIATLSGPVSVASAFGTPTVHTNGIPSTLHVTASDIWLPKLYRRRQDGHVLALAESISAPFRGELRGSGFDDYGIDLVANAADEIADAVDEMLDRLAGQPPVDDPQVAAIFERTANPFIAPISARFLARHRATLLGPA